MCSVAYENHVCLAGVRSDYANCASKDGSTASPVACLCGTKHVLKGEVCNYAKAEPAKLKPCGLVSSTGAFDGAGRSWKVPCACCNPDKTACQPATVHDTCTTAGKVDKVTTCQYVDGSKKAPVECICGSSIILPKDVCYKAGPGQAPERLQKCKTDSNNFISGSIVLSKCACCSEDTKYHDSPYCKVALPGQTCSFACIAKSDQTCKTNDGLDPGHAADVTICSNGDSTKTTEVACKCSTIAGGIEVVQPGGVCGTNGENILCSDLSYPEKDLKLLTSNLTRKESYLQNLLKTQLRKQRF